MKLRPKLVLAFVLVALVPLALMATIAGIEARRSLRESIGEHIATLVHEKAHAIDLVLRNRITETTVLAAGAEIREATRAATEAYDGRDEAAVSESIASLDAEWISKKKSGGSDTALRILGNGVSRFLQQYQQRNPDRYGEIFFTDVRGAAVGMTKILSDYDQSDEGWWQGGFAAGNGAVFVDDRGFDDTVGALVLGVVVPVRGDGGALTGVLKVNYKVREVLRIVAGEGAETDTVTFLARSLGSIVTHSGGDEEITLEEGELAVLSGVAGGHADNRRAGRRYIMGYGPIATEMATRVPSPGERRGISGERWEASRWWLFTEVPRSVALEPVARFTVTSVLGAAAAALCAILLALFVASTISRPLWSLHRGTEIIGRGDMDYRVGTGATDEIGQLSRAFDDMLDKLQAVTASRDELDRAKKELERSNKELEQFAYVASHDLQAPLRTVTSFTQMLASHLEGELDEKAELYMSRAVDGAQRMQRLINDLLSFSRVSSSSFEPEPVPVEHVLARAVENLREEIESSGAQVTHDALPIVLADPTQLTQLLQNLVGNAVKYRSEATPEVHVSAARDGSEWCFTVRDNGIGVDPRHAERIFVIFQRLHGRSEYSGTGIGLAICQKIVERFGGRIWIESQPGEGSALHFTIPAEPFEQS